MSDTNITPRHQETLEAIQGQEVALFSCFLDGEPKVALVVITEDDEEFSIRPFALLLEEDELGRLTNHDGEVPRSDRERE